MGLFFWFFFFSICLILAGCISSTSYKSATVEEGKVSFGQAVGFTTMQYPDENLLDTSTLKNSRIWPSSELFIQYGFSDIFGMGIKTNFASLIADAKFQYYDGEKLDMAFDLGFGTTSIPQIRDNETEYDTYNSIYPAAIFTLNFSENFRTSLSLEHERSFNNNPEGEESSTSFNGGSVNLSAGKDFNFIVQSSYFTGKDFKKRDVIIRSLGFAFVFVFD